MATARFFSWRFCLISAVTAALTITTVSLGFWQLRRAAAKQQIARSIESKAKLAPLGNADLSAIFSGSQVPAEAAEPVPSNGGAPWEHHRASLRGQWLHDATVFLDNRSMTLQGAHRYGFYVVTPLVLEDSADVLWVQRGWVPRHFQDRQSLPELPKALGVVQVDGRLMTQVSRIYELQPSPASQLSAPSHTVDSQIWQNLPNRDFSPRRLLPAALLQTSSESAASPDILQRRWPVMDTGVVKHHGYAVQWFALSGMFILLYVWFQLIAPRRQTKL